MIRDSVGNLYRTTYNGGKDIAGVVFKLTPVAPDAFLLQFMTFESFFQMLGARSGAESMTWQRAAPKAYISENGRIRSRHVA